MEPNNNKSTLPNPEVVFAEDEEDDNLSSGYTTCSEFWCSKKYDCDGIHSFSNELMRWKLDQMYGSSDSLSFVNGVEKNEEQNGDEVVDQLLTPSVGDGGLEHGGGEAKICPLSEVPSNARVCLLEFDVLQAKDGVVDTKSCD